MLQPDPEVRAPFWRHNQALLTPAEENESSEPGQLLFFLQLPSSAWEFALEYAMFLLFSSPQGITFSRSEQRPFLYDQY